MKASDAKDFEKEIERDHNDSWQLVRSMEILLEDVDDFENIQMKENREVVFTTILTVLHSLMGDIDETLEDLNDFLDKKLKEENNFD